ncbi:hypothetical protein Pint_16464 [Pistacia integerrima]|uniref:Uncharacterized protein n=1 Tax=Pistacia integerrima TaxID=434235 RepID=A0ACC0Z9B0_9ROSI|nr:hypothetical protein Pint_16464 [Pistacia integerrima]
MTHQLQLCLLFFVFTSLTHAKSVIEPCNTSDSCPSLLSYLLPYDSKLSEIAYRFQVNVSDILAANSIDPVAVPSLANQILPARSLVKVPISCPCVDGIRRSVSTAYTVQAADTVNSISDGFGGLVSGEQVGSFNGINATNPLTSGESLAILLPCTCFNNSNDRVAAVYLSYVVRRGESLGGIGQTFGTTVAELEAVNGLGQPGVDPGDILAVPIPACSSANLNWYNESLIVPNGSYALTAANCIKCTCGPTDLNLQCAPSGIVPYCSHLQCQGSDLFIGDAYVNHTPIGCNITACVYRGHNGGKIFRSLSNSSNVQCPVNQSNKAVPPRASPSSNPIVPFVILSPSPSPSPSASSNPTMGMNNTNPRSKQTSNTSTHGSRLPGQARLFYILLPLELALCFIYIS